MCVCVSVTMFVCVCLCEKISDTYLTGEHMFVINGVYFVVNNSVFMNVCFFAYVCECVCVFVYVCVCVCVRMSV